MTTTADKIKMIREYADKYDVGARRMAKRWFLSNTVFPEVINLKDDFDHVISTTSDIETYTDAQFRVFDQSNIAVLYGDFSYWTSLLGIIAEPCTFWLQAGDDLLMVVELILRSPHAHILLIEDDQSIEELDVLVEDYMRRGFPESSFEYKDGVVRVAPILPEET